jgi:hypothetical protein
MQPGLLWIWTEDKSNIEHIVQRSAIWKFILLLNALSILFRKFQ